MKKIYQVIFTKGINFVQGIQAFPLNFRDALKLSAGGLWLLGQPHEEMLGSKQTHCVSCCCTTQPSDCFTTCFLWYPILG